MKYKLIISDYDDTSLGDGTGLTDNTKAVIKKFTDKGGIFTFATGRVLDSILPVAKSVGVDSYVVSCNGASLYDVKAEKEVLFRNIENKDAIELLKDFESFNYTIQIYYDDIVMTNVRTEMTAYYEGFTGVTIHQQDCLSLFVEKENLDLHKILIFVDAKDNRRLIGEYKEKFGHIVEFSSSKPHLLECNSVLAGKGNMCLEVAKRLNIDPSEMICFGDGLNDLSMIKFAGLGIAVENACQELKDAADYVTDSNVNEGVAKAIEKFALID